MISAIIFDCFGVLYVDSRQAFYERHVKNYPKLHPQMKELDAQFDYGLLSRQQHDKQMSELIDLPIEFIDAHVESEHARNKELLLFAQSLRAKYKVGMLSNIGPQAMDDFFTPAERQKLFDAVVLSGDVGITKPHPQIYEIMAEKLGLPTGDCLMIDDLESNCRGADAAGMKTIHYMANQQTIEEVEKLLTR